jgi:hypothetical protein
MNVAKSFAIAASFATVAVGAAIPASADLEMSGHYTMTYSEHTDDYYFTPCGDGCASVTDTPGGKPFGTAHFNDGKWTLVDPDTDVSCDDGSTVEHAATSVKTWDAKTLTGVSHVTEKKAICGESEPEAYDNNFTLKKAS